MKLNQVPRKPLVLVNAMLVLTNVGAVLYRLTSAPTPPLGLLANILSVAAIVICSFACGLLVASSD